MTEPPSIRKGRKGEERRRVQVYKMSLSSMGAGLWVTDLQKGSSFYYVCVLVAMTGPQRLLFLKVWSLISGVFERDHRI